MNPNLGPDTKIHQQSLRLVLSVHLSTGNFQVVPEPPPGFLDFPVSSPKITYCLFCLWGEIWAVSVAGKSSSCGTSVLGPGLWRRCSENPGWEETSETVLVGLRTSVARSAPDCDELWEAFSICDCFWIMWFESFHSLKCRFSCVTCGMRELGNFCCLEQQRFSLDVWGLGSGL